jgi:hypothetical protein
MKRPSRLYRLLFLLALLCTVASAQPQPASAPLFITGPALSVNATANQHAISPYIYGMNFADSTLADDLQLPVNRWGGNATSRYNWQNDISNHASDWYFENIKESDATDLPNDSAVNRFIEQNQGTNTETLLTVPLIGYVSNNDDSACGFSISTYGAQTGNDWEWRPDCGNGISTANGNPFITGNDPLDTSFVITQSFVSNWAISLTASYGDASSGGVRFYNLDNEPGLWHETHRDVHPQNLTYFESLIQSHDYAAAIKAVDPAALTLGPVQDGWTRYFYSAYTEYPDPPSPGDRTSFGGNPPFVEWYLEHMQGYEIAEGIRLLDYFDLHYYPQAPGVTLSPAGSSATQALRLRSTRSLWDPTYVDESWIKDTEEGNMAVQLIPRMQDWVDTYYPGTKLAISEYNWGALDHINGALAQADVLGIFGRDGLDLATLWDPPTSTQPGAYAFRMYLNYDGNGNTFGDTSVSATSADQSQLSIYAATRSGDGALTLMVINKTGNSLTSNVTLANFTPFLTAQGYRYTGGTSISSFSQSVGPTGFSATFNANSITLFVLQPYAGPYYQVYLPSLKR